MQAIILAAGKGERLGQLGKVTPKILLDVAGTKIIDNIINSLLLANIKDITFITGNFTTTIKDYLQENYKNLTFNFIDESSKLIMPHNNIYSLYLAKDKLIKDDTIIIESDIIYNQSLIAALVHDSRANLVVGSEYQAYMNGTVYAQNDDSRVISYNKTYTEDINKYKTVNIYKLSKEFIHNNFILALNNYILDNRINDYYEYPLFECGIDKLQSIIIKPDSWYEIDTEQDYEIANIKYSSGEDKYNKLALWYGGYWRFPEIIDCCYLSNPFLDNTKLLANMQQNIHRLVTCYPTGNNIQIKNAARLFNLSPEYIVVGNGAGELIQALAKSITGNTWVDKPIYNEYFKFKQTKSTTFDNAKNIIIANPNNPSNKFYTKQEILNIITSLQSNQLFILDETFMDFAEESIGFSLLNNNFLTQHPNVIIIKSLGKCYNINGLKLGVLATANNKLLNKIKQNLPAWNINAFADYMLQEIADPRYKTNHKLSCKAMRDECERVRLELSKISELEVKPSQTNFITIIFKNINSYTFCVEMLKRYNIFIKDLSSKGINGIRLAINSIEINNTVINCFKQYFNIEA